MVAPPRTMVVATPGTMVKVKVLLSGKPLALAVNVADPTRTPVKVTLATPLVEVSLPVPVTVPAPPVWAKVTTVELSPVRVFPAASWIVAVIARVVPEARFVVRPVRLI